MIIKIAFKNNEIKQLRCDNLYYQPKLDCFTYITDGELKTIQVDVIDYIYIERD